MLCIDIFKHLNMSTGKEIDVQDVNANTEEISVASWQDFTTVCAYITECQIYNRPFTTSDILFSHERAKFVDLFMQLLRFQ